jgi:hypothetical protein
MNKITHYSLSIYTKKTCPTDKSFFLFGVKNQQQSLTKPK